VPSVPDRETPTLYDEIDFLLLLDRICHRFVSLTAVARINELVIHARNGEMSDFSLTHRDEIFTYLILLRLEEHYYCH